MSVSKIPVKTEISNKNVTCIYLVINGEWAYFYVHQWEGSNGFTLTINSSFGVWGYGWSSPGSDKAKFLQKSNRGYVASKMNPTKVFDQEVMEKGLKLDIIEHRREESISAATARKAWDALDDALRHHSQEGIMHFLYHHEETDYFSDDPDVFDCAMIIPRSWTHFYDCFWGDFLNALKNNNNDTTK